MFDLNLELEDIVNLDVFENFKLNPCLEFRDETARLWALRATHPVEINLEEILVQLVAFSIPWSLAVCLSKSLTVCEL